MIRLKTVLFSLTAIALLCSIPIGYKRYKIHQLWHARPYLTVVGPINLTDGLGRQTAELIETFQDEFPVGAISYHKEVTGLSKLSKKTQTLLKRSNRNLGKVIIYEDTLWSPSNYNVFDVFKSASAPDQIRLSYSMLESTKVPSEWVFILNTYFDAVVVPDPFLVEAYQSSGVTIPIFVLPLGLCLNDFLETPLKKAPHSPLVFANFSTGLDRKNHLMLVRAFAKAFGNRKEVELKINCPRGEEAVLAKLQQEIAELKSSNITLTQLALDHEAYLQLFQSVDCYVSLSKGEGFSIQPREAMALGIPVIATDNTGQHTICESGLVKSISSKQAEPAFYWGSNLEVGNRFNCEEQEVIEALQEVFNQYGKYLERADEARKWAGQYNYKELKSLYKTLIKPQTIQLGQENKITPGTQQVAQIGSSSTISVKLGLCAHSKAKRWLFTSWILLLLLRSSRSGLAWDRFFKYHEQIRRISKSDLRSL